MAGCKANLMLPARAMDELQAQTSPIIATQELSAISSPLPETHHLETGGKPANKSQNNESKVGIRP
jgi:hypothetical protein